MNLFKTTARRAAILALALAIVPLASSTASAQFYGPRGGGYYNRGYYGGGYRGGYYGPRPGYYGPRPAPYYGRPYGYGYGRPFYGPGYYGAPYATPYVGSGFSLSIGGYPY